MTVPSILWPSRASKPVSPKHFVPSPFAEVSSGAPWHEAYLHQARELVADSEARELLLLKGELDSLFAAAQEIQQAVHGYRRQLLDPKLTAKHKERLKAQLEELETELERTRNRSRKVREQIESAQNDVDG